MSAYQFDDNGTTIGQTEELIITYSEKKHYTVADHIREKYTVTLEPNTLKFKPRSVKKTVGQPISDSLLLSLLSALTHSELPTKTFETITQEYLNEEIDEKRIVGVAKWNNEAWQFKRRYSTPEKNQAYYAECQQLDTFRCYLSQQFDSTGYAMVTDYSNTIWITVKTEKEYYKFEGKYPNPVKQPWYDHTPKFPRAILNLNINLNLEELLPPGFLMRKSITMDALLEDYVLWYMQRSGKVF